MPTLSSSEGLATYHLSYKGATRPPAFSFHPVSAPASKAKGTVASLARGFTSTWQQDLKTL